MPMHMNKYIFTKLRSYYNFRNLFLSFNMSCNSMIINTSTLSFFNNFISLLFMYTYISFLFIYLAVLGLSCGMRDRSWAPCIGSVASQPTLSFSQLLSI